MPRQPGPKEKSARGKEEPNLEIKKKPPTLYLTTQGVRPLTKGHLWVYSGAVTKVTGRPGPGDVVALADGANKFVGWAWYSPDSRIRARVLSLRREEEFAEGWWQARLGRARELRSVLEEEEGTDAYRLVNSEADGLPGLVVDLFGRSAVVRALTPGADRLKKELAEVLAGELSLDSVVEKGDEVIRRFEGLPSTGGLLWGKEPGPAVAFSENRLKYEADLKSEMSGWYSDQRRNRALAAAYSKGGRVLDCFAFSGAFSVAALAAGAKSATLVDSSSKALRQARQNLKLNGLEERADLIQGNVFNVLRQYLEGNRLFETVILDPDPWAASRNQAQKAGRAYKDSNLMALKMLAPGGILATFSRSAGVEEEAFLETLGWAARDAGKRIQILARLSQPEDHPILLGHPETETLKGYLCRAL